MKEKFWLNLSGILLASALSLSFSLAWFFSVYQSRRFNHQTQRYLSEHFSVLYNQIQVYLKKKDEPSFSQLQKILSLYFVDTLNKPSIKGKSSKVLDKHLAQPFMENATKKFVFLLNNSGLVLAHSESEYSGKSLPKSSMFFSLIQQYSQGWNRIVKQDKSDPLITVAQPVNIASVKYFVVAGQSAQSPWNLIFILF